MQGYYPEILPYYMSLNINIKDSKSQVYQSCNILPASILSNEIQFQLGQLESIHIRKEVLDELKATSTIRAPLGPYIAKL